MKGMRQQLLWLRDYVHLIVNLEMGVATAPPEVLAFIGWLADPKGEMPELAGERATTRTRLSQMLDARPGRAA